MGTGSGAGIGKKVASVVAGVAMAAGIGGKAVQADEASAAPSSDWNGAHSQSSASQKVVDSVQVNWERNPDFSIKTINVSRLDLKNNTIKPVPLEQALSDWKEIQQAAGKTGPAGMTKEQFSSAVKAVPEDNVFKSLANGTNGHKDASNFGQALETAARQGLISGAEMDPSIREAGRGLKGVKGHAEEANAKPPTSVSPSAGGTIRQSADFEITF